LGCGVVEADVTTVDGAKKAFEDAEIAFVMTPTDFTHDNVAERVRASRLSSMPG